MGSSSGHSFIFFFATVRDSKHCCLPIEPILGTYPNVFVQLALHLVHSSVLPSVILLSGDVFCLVSVGDIPKYSTNVSDYMSVPWMAILREI